MFALLIALAPVTYWNPQPVRPGVQLRKFRSFVATPAQEACLDRQFARRQHDHVHIGIGAHDPFAICGMIPDRPAPAKLSKRAH